MLGKKKKKKKKKKEVGVLRPVNHYGYIRAKEEEEKRKRIMAHINVTLTGSGSEYEGTSVYRLIRSTFRRS